MLMHEKYLFQSFFSFENSRHLQEKHKADKFNNLGKVKWELAVSLLIVFIVVYFALWKGIKSSGKVRDCRRVRNSLEWVHWLGRLGHGDYALCCFIYSLNSWFDSEGIRLRNWLLSQTEMGIIETYESKELSLPLWIKDWISHLW